MDLNKLFESRVFLSRQDREDRRKALVPRLEAAGIRNVKWFPSIDQDSLNGDTRGFVSLAKRSCAVSKRLIIREACRCKQANLLFLEDDVIFDANFEAKVRALQLPDDWGMFYFGCQHVFPPQWVSAGVVRIQRALDMHAVGINRRYFLHIRKAMRGAGKWSRGNFHSDVLLSRLHSQIPTYAAFPNLAWQSYSYSDNIGRSLSHYDSKGTQIYNQHALLHLYPYVPEFVDAILLRAPKEVMDSLRDRGWHNGYWRDKQTGRDNGIHRLLASSLDNERLQRILCYFLRILQIEAERIGAIVTVWEDGASKDILQADGIKITEIKAKSVVEAESELKRLNSRLYDKVRSNGRPGT